MDKILPVSKSQAKRLAVQSKGTTVPTIRGLNQLQAVNKVRKDVAALAAKFDQEQI